MAIFVLLWLGPLYVVGNNGNCRKTNLPNVRNTSLHWPINANVGKNRWHCRMLVIFAYIGSFGYCIYILYNIIYISIYIWFTPTYHKVANTIPNGWVEISGIQMLWIMDCWEFTLICWIQFQPLQGTTTSISIYCLFTYFIPNWRFIVFIVGSLPHWYWWYTAIQRHKKKQGLFFRCCSSARQKNHIDEFIVFLSDPNLRPPL